MAFTMRAVKVQPNSASLEEARHRVFDFFKQACRSIPTIMQIYNLEDVVTPAQIRSSIAQQISRNQEITNPKVRSLPTHFSTFPLSFPSIPKSGRTLRFPIWQLLDLGNLLRNRILV
jgi:hypothetical protein